MPSQVPVIQKSEFASRLADLMREQRISTEAMARQTGISVRLLRKYRAGKTVPQDYFGGPTRNLLLLADALHVDASYLLSGDTERAA